MAVHVAKIMDGIFMGSKEAAQDLNFLMVNKIAGVINCTGHALPNYAANMGVKYLTFRWLDRPKTVIFGQKGRNIIRIFKFIERIRANGGSLLIHSMDGTGRCVLVVVSFLMRKFQWGLGKSLELVALKRPDINPDPGFLHQLGAAAQALQLPWNDQHDTFETRWLATPPATPLESVITNTFLNAHAHLFLTSEEQEAQQAEEAREQQQYKQQYMNRLRNKRNHTQQDDKPKRIKLMWQDETASPSSRAPSASAKKRTPGGGVGSRFNGRRALSPAHNPLVRPPGWAYGTFSQLPNEEVRTVRPILKRRDSKRRDDVAAHAAPVTGTGAGGPGAVGGDGKREGGGGAGAGKPLGKPELQLTLSGETLQGFNAQEDNNDSARVIVDKKPPENDGSPRLVTENTEMNVNASARSVDDIKTYDMDSPSSGKASEFATPIVQPRLNSFAKSTGIANAPLHTNLNSTYPGTEPRGPAVSWGQKQQPQQPQAPLTRRLSGSGPNERTFTTQKPHQRPATPGQTRLPQNNHTNNSNINNSTTTNSNNNSSNAPPQQSQSLITAFSVRGSANIGNGLALQYQKLDRASNVPSSNSNSSASGSYALDNMSKRLHNSNSTNNNNSNNTALPSPKQQSAPQAAPAPALPNYMSPTKSSSRPNTAKKTDAPTHTPTRPTTAPSSGSTNSGALTGSFGATARERASSASNRSTDRDRVIMSLGSRLDSSLRLNNNNNSSSPFSANNPYASYNAAQDSRKRAPKKQRLKKLKANSAFGPNQSTRGRGSMRQAGGSRHHGHHNNNPSNFNSFGLGIGGVGLL